MSFAQERDLSGGVGGSTLDGNRPKRLVLIGERGEESRAWVESVASKLRETFSKLEVVGDVRRGMASAGKLEFLWGCDASWANESDDGSVLKLSDVVRNVCKVLVEECVCQWDLDEAQGKVVHLLWPCSLVAKGFVPVSIHACRADSFGVGLWWWTGGEQSRRFVSDAAKRKGMRIKHGALWRCMTQEEFDSLTSTDLYVGYGDERVPCATEESLFEALGVEWVPPHERERTTWKLVGRQMLRPLIGRDPGDEHVSRDMLEPDVDCNCWCKGDVFKAPGEHSKGCPCRRDEAER